MSFQNLISKVRNWYNQSNTPVNLSILEDLNDFDIILFKGQDYWFSYVVEYVTWSEFSHVGIYLNGATGIKPGLITPVMLESGYEYFPDEIENKIKFGVQISDVQRVVNEYTGKVYIRRLNISGELRQQAKQALTEVYQQIADMPYDYDVFDLLRAEFDIDVGDVQKTNEFFCSALVAYVYAKLGFLSPQIAWDLIRPKDFGNDYINQNLLDDANYGPLTRIK